ncbi:hypothetical protein BKD30_01585 [Tersicoccus phoenicis]|uniref:Uncharacterized protein n=1 Tax=Tersicoccus phoenicis TaxID=554083 RepID=A0A1R1LL96_9MICC|nr:DUF2017 domain-containing protein [Tersicoccus phoenicis]OMH28246.1 hypothetical protein BKD30_01585 [Tersicoccus phoenicis]
MAHGFRSTRRGITGFLEDAERELLGKLFRDVASMLEPRTTPDDDPLAALVGIDAEATVPEDTAVRRLLPDGVDGDDEAALEFRRLTERGLREQKTAGLRAAELLIEAEPIQLDTDQAAILSKAINDVRLVLADRLNLVTDEDANRLHDITDWAEATDLESYLALVYNFLTWLQDTLMQALLRSLDR